MINISTLFDPRYVFLFYAPILFAINKRVAHRLIIALTATEWSNQILKWLLAGERPYWYVHERAIETAAANQQLSNFTTGIDSYDMAAILSGASQQQQQQPLANFKQFSVTCEMGAGSPSGHAMVTATVWYILIDAYLKGELNPFYRRSPVTAVSSQADNSLAAADNHLTKLSWAMYALFLVLVSMSRVYLACHFPHQCLCGAILGVMVAKLAQRVPMERFEKRHYFGATVFMFATAMGTYALLRSLGVDPLWTINKAMRWCAKKEYIMLDTTPFFSMIRYLAFFLGAGLAFNRNKLVAVNEKQIGGAQVNNGGHGGHLLLFVRRLIGAFSAVMLVQFLLSLPIPKANVTLFYLISFLMYTLMAFSIAGPVPRLVKRSVISLATNQKLKAL